MSVIASQSRDNTKGWLVLQTELNAIDDQTSNRDHASRRLPSRRSNRRRGQAAAAEHEDGEPGESCPWCTRRYLKSNGSDGTTLALTKSHTLVQCVWPTPRGDIPGCPRCNTMDHHLDICPVPAQNHFTDAAAKNEWWSCLIGNRGGRPPFRTTRSWPTIAVENGTIPGGGFPVSKAFAREQHRTNRQQFVRYLEGGVSNDQPGRFLDDPATATLFVVRANLDALNQTEVYVQRVDPKAVPTDTGDKADNEEPGKPADGGDNKESEPAEKSAGEDEKAPEPANQGQGEDKMYEDDDITIDVRADKDVDMEDAHNVALPTQTAEEKEWLEQNKPLEGENIPFDPNHPAFYDDL